MSVITISRGSLSGGQELAERVAQQLAYRCVSREVLMEAAARYGIPELKLDELFEKKPSFWEWLTRSRERYLVFIQAAMCEVALASDLVYHGQAGQQLLPGIPHVLKVRLITPVERRIRNAMEQRHMDHETAAKHIQRIDDERYHRMRDLFDVDWRDPTLYDLILNTEHMSLDAAADVVVSLVQKPDFQPTAESKQALDDLAVASRVKAALAIHPSTGDVLLDVQANAGVVHLSGVITAIDDGRLEDEIKSVALATAGVSSVVLDIQFRPVLAQPG
jgi:cytidylate kinase